MATRARRVTLEPDVVTRLDSTSETDKVGGLSMVVRNQSAEDCELGGADLATGEGFELLAGEAMPFSYLPTKDKGVYALCSVEIELQILESGV